MRKEYDFSKLKGRKNPYAKRLKKQITIRFGVDILEYFKELAEETGITRDKAEIIRESRDWLPYDLPRHLVPKLWGGRYRGQKQRWFAIRFHGADADVNIATEVPEFRVWTWMAHEELISRIVPFKRDTYSRVFAEFGDLIS